MKIVILHPHHWQQSLGGAELQISYLIRYLVKRGHKLYFIYMDIGLPIRNDENIHLFPLKRIIVKDWFGRGFSLYGSKIKKALKRIQPDVIYTRSFLSWSGIASTYAKKQGIKHIWAIANDKELKRSIPSKYIFQPLNLLEIYITKKAFKSATYIITQNSYQQTAIEKKFKRRSIKINQMSPSIDGEKLFKSKKMTIVWIAHLRILKHPEYFIQLVEELYTNDNLSFLMMGKMDHNYDNLIHNTTRKIKNFQYLGEIPNDSVNELLCKAHILINTSDYEGFSNTFIQAWMRKVIVISMKSNPDNIITKHKIGYMCNSIDCIKDKINQLLDDKNLLCEMGEKAHKYAVQNHSLESIIPTVAELMD